MPDHRCRSAPVENIEAAAGSGILSVAPWSIVAFIIIGQIYAVLLTLIAGPSSWVDFLQDDAYYYLAIARNISQNGLSAFSLPTETNGYQPLWLVILSLIAKTVASDRILLVAATHLLSLASIVSFLFLSRRHYGVAWPAATAVLLFPNIMTAGMETILIPPLAILYLRSTSPQMRGLFASLLFLTRLDALAFVAGRVFYELLTHRRVCWSEHIPLVITIACYFGVNLALFGTPVPVSGLAKAIGNVPGENLPTSVRFLRRVVPSLIALMPLIALRISRSYSFRNPEAVAASLAATVVSALYYGLFSGWPLWSWYLWPVMLVVYFTLLELSGVRHRLPPAWALPSKVWKVISVTLISTHMLAAVWVYHARFGPIREYVDGRSEGSISYGQDNVHVANALNKRVGLSERIAMGDRAGSLGYFLDERIALLQLEGLVGSYEQIRQMRADRTLSYIGEFKPDWLIVDRDEPLMLIDGQVVIEEPLQGLSVHKGSFALCYPAQARLPLGSLGSRRDQRYIFWFDQKEACSPAAQAWFEQWRSTYHGPIHGDLGLPPLFMSFPGDY
jgi:hypothetical protein